MNDFKYVFGPIPSRRLGRSLGISPLPKKTCNYSCIYCQLGRTDKMTNKRQEFYKTEDIIAEFKQYLKDSDKFDIVTVVGEGEPTLAANLGELVVALKALTDKPVAVITNGALLSDPQVREELCHADMVLPSLDAYNQEISKKIDRPYGTIKFEEEFEGLKKFTHMYEGELWLEIMLVDGINDDEQSILKFQELLKELKAKLGPVGLVLHGGTGVSDEDMKRCVREGMKKINVGTELNKNYIEVVSKTFTADDVTPLTSLRNLLGPANERIKEIVIDKASLFKL